MGSFFSAVRSPMRMQTLTILSSSGAQCPDEIARVRVREITTATDPISPPGGGENNNAGRGRSLVDDFESIFQRSPRPRSAAEGVEGPAYETSLPRKHLLQPSVPRTVHEHDAPSNLSRLSHAESRTLRRFLRYRPRQICQKSRICARCFCLSVERVYQIGLSVGSRY